MTEEKRAPFPPFDEETAKTKVRMAENGLMKVRFASINDLAIDKAERKLIWESDIRPDDYPSLSEMGL